MHRVEVPREIVDLGDVGVALVAIGHQANLRSGVGLPEAIWLEMDQIFCLAPSMSPPMLPVVSRQKTTSTFGFFTSGFLSSPIEKPSSQSRQGSQCPAQCRANLLFVPRVDAPQAAK